MNTKKKFWNKDFNLVVIGQVISLFGNTILKFALSLYILEITGSAAIFGSILAFSMIPMVVFSPFGGIAADRMNRRNIMVVLDFTTAGLVFFAYFLMDDGNGILITAIVMTCLSVIQAFYTPSVQSSVPFLQEEHNIGKGNAVVNQVSMLAGLLGPILGGVCYGIFGTMPIVLASGICFFISAVIEIFIRMPYIKSEKKGRAMQVVKEDFTESIAYVGKKEPAIMKTCLIMGLFNLFLSSMIVIGAPYIINITLGMSSQLYGFAQGAMSAAGLAGGILAGVMADKADIRKLYKLLIAAGVLLLPIAAVFIINGSEMMIYWVMLIMLMLLQGGGSLFSIILLSAVQKKTPLKLLGKVTSFILMICMCAQPAGQALYGILFDFFSGKIYIIMIGTAFITIIIGIFSRPVLHQLAGENLQKDRKKPVVDNPHLS